ncbi:LacI family transcriptional regulator [Corynebacterium sp. sy017]|uniref:LacI family DNA-binding transcriptional regulator n=1 Tax=unclassified Corynebacterium TaxID=2624378 RepID=UPI001185E13E|nr:MULTISPECIES: LacI family DNA-binding transcriptional regulator [unclassified Corynebacterium]MBP3088496.1 LacI family transcriptional regulator [Corynebacterium sp. sy017]TSD91801.1 LacI family transcriptional regulator [Corynebacterium sp. SY003]
MTPPHNRITMADVAREAGVSRSSVSRVFLGQKKVSAENRRKVLEVAERLGYVPNVIASELASHQSRTVGLLLRDAANPAYGLLFTELQRQAQAAGINVVSMTISIDRHEQQHIASLNHLLGMQVAGLIVATGSVPSEKLVPFHNRLPIIRAGRPEPTGKIHAVSYDEVDAGTRLAHHVAHHGHRHVAVICTAPTASYPEWVRASSMITTLAEHNVQVTQIHADHDDNGHNHLAQCLDTPRNDTPITAIMCPSDVRQLEVIRWAKARGFAIPDDLSITGCDGIMPGIDLLGISTYRIDVAGVATRVIEHITNLISAQAPPATIINETLPGTLIPGHTVAQPLLTNHA